jgi:excisionase family DNA binding protein
MDQSQETPVTPMLLTIPQTAQVLGLGKTKVYELIWKENLPVHKFGRSVRISPSELQLWLQQRRERL